MISTLKRFKAAIVVVALTQLLLVGLNAESPKSQSTSFVGIWRQCYEPGFPGVSEIDRGYLILMPGKQYVEISEVVDSPLITETGRYEPTKQGVTLHPETRTRPDGTPGGGHVFKPWRLRLLPAHPIVFWAQRDHVITTDVLTPGDSANYGFARVL